MLPNLLLYYGMWLQCERKTDRIMGCIVMFTVLPVPEENPGRLKLYCFTSSYQRSATSFPAQAHGQYIKYYQNSLVSFMSIRMIALPLNLFKCTLEQQIPPDVHFVYNTALFVTQCNTVGDVLWRTPSCTDIFLQWVMVSELSNRVQIGGEIDPSCSLERRDSLHSGSTLVS